MKEKERDRPAETNEGRHCTVTRGDSLIERHKCPAERRIDRHPCGTGIYRGLWGSWKEVSHCEMNDRPQWGLPGWGRGVWHAKERTWVRKITCGGKKLRCSCYRDQKYALFFLNIMLGKRWRGCVYTFASLIATSSVFFESSKREMVVLTTWNAVEKSLKNSISSHIT